MKNSKRWISGAMAAFLLLCAGCGQNSNGENSATAEAEQKPVVEQVTDQEMTLSFNVYADDSAEKEVIEREGKYTGQLVDGVPDGEGKFVTSNTAGQEWYYEGTFSQGAATGEGVQCWPELNQKYVGHFVDGELDATKGERIFNCVRKFSTDRGFSSPVELDSSSQKFIEDHADIFPAVDDAAKEKAKSMIDASVEYKHLTKNVAPYLGKLVYFKNQIAVQVISETMWGKAFTFILTTDSNYTNYQVLMYDGDVDVFDNDNITFVALPVANSGFENTNGGTTNVVVEVASIIIKN